MSRFVLTAQLQLQAPTNVGQVVTQIQNQLNGINVNLQVQGSAQAQRQIQQVTQSCNNATSAAGRMGQAFAVSIRRFAAFSIATRAVGLFTSTLSDAVQTAIDFERQLIKLSQVTGDNVGKLRDLTNTITGLSLRFGVSSQSLLETTTALIQAGISSKDTKVALDALAKSALAPNFDSLSETTEGAIAILAQFKLGVGALEGQLSSINAVAGAFAVEASDLIDVVRRTGGVFKSSGGDLNELLALFTSVRATTRESAESIGTGLRTIFTRIQRPKTIEFLKQFGVELVDLNGKFVGPYEAVKRLSDALSGLGEGDITFIKIAEELGGFRQIGKVLPLLQQFATAEQALNVAQNANNSLSKDAATAQAALAVRIIKVKEEFLALVRGITETSTFQIMANTALNLASALIKIADAIKPLLPLLTAVAAVNIAKGIGSFAANVAGGLRSGRTFHQGGKVHKFASGGLVPGVGNSDTVPAMLSPGEFVIRKSSVQSLGASNLAGMNSGGSVSKYATGGIVVDPTKIGAFFLRPEEGIDRTGASMKGVVQITNNSVLKRLGVADSKGDTRQQAFDNLTKEKQASLLGLSTVPKGKIDSSKFFRQGSVNLTNSISSPGRQALRDKGISKEQIDSIDINKVQNRLNRGIEKGKLAVGAKSVPMSGSVSSYFPGKDDFQTSSVAGVIAENTRKGLYNTVLKSVDPVLQRLNNPAISVNRQQAKRGASKIANDPNAKATTEGFIFEGLIKSITGAKLSGNQANFDFPSGSMSSSKSALKAMFANLSGEGIDSLIKADAKRSNSRSAIDSIKNKIANDINANRLEGITLSKFATGGRVKGIEGAPLVDDIPQASGSILPRPSMAIQALIKAGGGAVDVDRTLKRTIGDAAYAKAPTSGAKNASLETYFRDENKRLQDLKTAPITQFGKELQAAIKNGQLNARKVSIISKSKRVKGAAEYLSSQFGIPVQNMIFTQGGSKQPALDAIRNKGPRIDRIARFAVGGGAGTDTIPALLTPGEFVVNRDSAQRIGYGNLHHMNKVGKFANGGTVGKVQRFIRGGVAEQNVDRAQGSVLSSISEAESVFASLLKEIAPEIKTAILDGWRGIKELKATDTFASGKSAEGVRGVAIGSESMRFQIQGKKAAATTETVAHETGHIADFALGGKSGGYASQQQGTFQFAVVEKVKPVMEAAFQKSGMSAEHIADYLTKNEELFAEFFAKASPEVRQILTSTTDAKVGMEALSKHLGDTGFTYAGLEASDLNVPKTSPAAAPASPMTPPSGPPNIPPKPPTPTTTTPPSKNGFSTVGGTMGVKAGGSGGGKSGGNQASTQATQQATQATMGFGLGLAAVSATMQSMLKPLDENSGAMDKLSHSVLGMITTIGGVVMALEGFGIKLNGDQLKDFFTGKKGPGQVARSANSAVRSGLRSVGGGVRDFGQSIGSSTITGLGKGISGLARPLGNAANGLTKLAGPALAAAAGVAMLNNVISSFDDSTQRKNTAIKTGNVAEAGKAAQQEAELSNANNARMVGGTVGGAIGSFLGPVGTAVGAAAGAAIGTLFATFAPELTQQISEAFGGKTMGSIVSLAQAQAQATKTQKAFEEGEKDATSAMEDLNNGTITAAEGLQRIASVTQESINLQNANQKAITENTKNRAGGASGIARDAISGLSFGLLAESSSQRNAKIDAENAALAKTSNETQAKSFEMSRPLMNAAIKESITFSKSPEEAKANMNKALGENSPEALQARAKATRLAAQREDVAGNKESASQLRLNATQLEKQAEQLEKSFTNLNKEIETNRKAFEAMNLGLSAVNGAASASALKINNFVNSLEAGASPMEGALATLEAGVTGAAQGISDADFGAALNQAGDTLTKFGADAAQVTKFKGNVTAVNNAQKNSAKIFEDVKSTLSATGNQSADTRKEAVINSIAKNSGLAEGSEELNNFKKSLQGADIDLEKLANGDLSVFENALKDLGENAIGQAKEALMAEIKINQQLVALTKQRIDAERNLVEAQKEALQLGMEGREIQAKYGGKAITDQDRRGNVIGQANVGAGRLGLTEMKSGSIEELKQRRKEITTNFGNAEVAKRTEGALNGTKGAEASEVQKDLAKESKAYVQTVRDLIKAEEENLKTIEAKNKLEKDSMESLMSGDIEKFFQQQAAVGATAAIATGSQSLMGAFGAEALGGAHSNIQKMQEAGVTELYGQRIAGAGGLGERTAQSALRARGVTDPRAAQVAAGTTAEEEASKSRLRALGGELSQAGQMGVDMAQMELQTATMNLEKATIYAKSGVEVVQGRQEEAAQGAGAAQGKALGGLIYASMGKFIPRGTDTVPAMLTPGEFVVRRDAVNRGNNLALLQAINTGTTSTNNMVAGFAKGGRVQYFDEGSKNPVSQVGGGVGMGLDPAILSKFSDALNNFNDQLKTSIDKLTTTKFQVTLDTANVNVNLTGGSFLMSLKDSIKKELLDEVGEKIKNYSVTEGGGLKDNSGKILQT
jgi:TP901 family phage tail tape measure protein